MPTLNLNGKPVTVNLPADTSILWTLRDELGLTGSKFGCGMALCGAYTVHLDGVAIHSCIIPAPFGAQLKS
jgi:isoquinoline 1-oxidoreductase subunit alpha